jgi:hypothetical protein
MITFMLPMFWGIFPWKTNIFERACDEIMQSAPCADYFANILKAKYLIGVV